MEIAQRMVGNVSVTRMIRLLKHYIEVEQLSEGEAFLVTKNSNEQSVVSAMWVMGLVDSVVSDNGMMFALNSKAFDVYRISLGR